MCPSWGYVKPVVRAFDLSQTACKRKCRRIPRSHSSCFLIFVCMCLLPNQKSRFWETKFARNPNEKIPRAVCSLLQAHNEYRFENRKGFAKELGACCDRNRGSTFGPNAFWLPGQLNPKLLESYLCFSAMGLFIGLTPLGLDHALILV